MALTTDDKKAIITYRLQKADKAMIEAYDNARLGHWSWEEEDIQPLFPKAETVLQKIKTLITFK